jgi:raffinose/stachyose/melibiose transport system permease protein
MKPITGRYLINSLIWLLSLLIILPIFYILTVSVSSPQGFADNFFSFLSDFKVENYVIAWTQGRISTYMLNTVVVCVVAISIVIFTASFCAYGISRFNHKYKEVGLVYYLIISGLFIPVQAIILPLFKLMKTFHLLNSLFGLALVYISANLPLSMMLFAGFFKSIPRELEEAAVVDGCGPYKVYWKIIFPLSKTIMATVTILAGLNIWRDFFIPLVIVTEPTKKTLGIGLLAFVNEFSLDWPRMCAAMVMMTIPIVALFIALQKYFISGAVAGAVKG